MNDGAKVDYSLSESDAWHLQAVSVLPVADRRDLLATYAAERGTAALVSLFAEFVGLANSVVVNNREMVELVLMCDGNMVERDAEAINLPTIFGALQGVKLANAVNPAKTCEGCAFRLGTPANQSPITTCDASDAADNSERFFCHIRGLDAHGMPTRVCVGHAQHAANSSANLRTSSAPLSGGAQ